jgi:hypothetical protein
VLITPDAGRSSVDVRFGCLLPAVLAPRDQIRGSLLGQILQETLMQRMRGDIGASYAPTVRTVLHRGGSFDLEGRLDVDAKALPHTLELLRDWLDPAGGASIDERMFRRARLRAARTSALRATRSVDMAHLLFNAWSMDWPLALVDQYPRDLGSLTPGDLASALAACRTSAVVSVLGGS